MPDLELAYDACRLIAKREAKNFYYAFITLPPEKASVDLRVLRLLPALRRRQ